MNNKAFLVTKEKNTCAAGKVVLKHCVRRADYGNLLMD